MASETKTFYGVSTVAIVTGASKGIGRAIAIEFAKRFTEGLLLVLTGRSEKDLQETVSLIQADSSFSPSRTTIRSIYGDLANQMSLQHVFEGLFKDMDPAKYDHAILVNNAGSLGDVSKYVRDFTLDDMEGLQDYFFLNVNCPLLLTSKFLSVFSSKNEKGPSKHTIVQITSLAGVQATKSLSMYCTGKAARDMLHKVVAAEEPHARVLNYAPGPVDTAMFHHIKDGSVDPDTASAMKKSFKIVLQPEKTASILCDFLGEDKYESGAHVDVFDIIGLPKMD